MTMIDLKNLDKLNPEQKQQFNALLDQYPHLTSKMETSRELNTPSKMEIENDELDYSSFIPSEEKRPYTASKEALPQLKVDPDKSSFSSLDQEEKPLTKRDKQEIELEKRQERIRAGINAGQSPEVANFSDEGKIHPILQKMRATLGMRSVQEPVSIDLGGCKYSMRPLDRSHIAQATVLALSSTTNGMVYEANLEAAIVAQSIVAIDNVPLAEIFSIPKDEIPLGGNEPVSLTHLQREEKAAEALYLELLRSPNELVEGLSVFYQQEFPTLNLLGEGKAKYLCPAPNCLQSRIAEKNTSCYCPIHGEKMAQEETLPNPS